MRGREIQQTKRPSDEEGRKREDASVHLRLRKRVEAAWRRRRHDVGDKGSKRVLRKGGDLDRLLSDAMCDTKGYH